MRRSDLEEAVAEAERRWPGIGRGAERAALDRAMRGGFEGGAEWQAEQHKTVLDAVRELHRPARLVRGEAEFCHECTDPWPCRTIRTLEERTDT